MLNRKMNIISIIFVNVRVRWLIPLKLKKVPNPGCLQFSKNDGFCSQLMEPIFAFLPYIDHIFMKPVEPSSYSELLTA